MYPRGALLTILRLEPSMEANVAEFLDDQFVSSGSGALWTVLEGAPLYTDLVDYESGTEFTIVLAMRLF